MNPKSSQHTADSEPCPPATDLWAAARGELDPLTTLRLNKHAQQCENCGEARRLGKFLAVEMAPLEMNRQQLRGGAWEMPRIGRAWIGLAIVVVLAAFAFLVLWLALPK